MAVIKKSAFWIGPSFSDVHNDWETTFLGMNKLPLVIGLSGPTKCGKTIIAKQLSTGLGFQYINLATYLNKVKKSRGITDRNWNVSYAIGVELRQQFGNNILAYYAIKDIISKYRGQSRFVVDGIFHPEEVLLFRRLPRFALVWVNVDFNLRVEVASDWYNEIVDVRSELEERDTKERLHKNDIQDSLANLFQCSELANESMNVTQKEGFNHDTVFRRFENLIKGYIND